MVVDWRMQRCCRPAYLARTVEMDLPDHVGADDSSVVDLRALVVSDFDTKPRWQRFASAARRWALDVGVVAAPR